MSTDFFPPIQRAVQGLSPNSHENRSALYEKARAALLRQLNAADPALTPGQISRERSLLEEAIRRVEHHYDEAELALEPMASERPAAPKPASITDDEAGEDDEAAREGQAVPSDRVEADKLPAFVERRVEKRRPQAPRRNTSNGGFKRYAAAAAAAILIVGGGVGFALFLRGHDDKAVLVPAQPATQVATKPATADPAKLDDRLGSGPAPAPPSNQMAATPPAPQINSVETRPEPVPGQPKPGSTPAPLIPSTQAEAPDGQRARMLEEDPSAPMKGRIFEGTVNWRTESQPSGTNGPLETVVLGELSIPDRKMKAVLTLRRNSDPAFPSAFVLQIQMSVPPDYPNGNVGMLSGVSVKPQPEETGIPLDGILMKVTTGMFLMGIADPFNEKGRNARMMQNNEWFDIMFTFDNGRKAVVTFEKGPTGDKVFNDAMAAWNIGTATAQ